MVTKKKIIFKSILGKESEKYLNLPQPSKKLMPEWYKQTPIFNNKNDYDTLTIKKCMPFLDALSMGYTISTGWEIAFKKIKTQDGKDGYNISYPAVVRDLLQDHAIGLETHTPFQFPSTGFNNDEIPTVVKILSPWIIKTPPGYSCLFVPPLNHLKSPLRVLSGVVDTDTYHLPINFPSIPLKFTEGHTILPEGTPLIMVIPFKREAWNMEIEYSDRASAIETKVRRLDFFRKILDNYKSKAWHKKDFN